MTRGAAMLPAFVESLPRRPYCTDNPRLGQSVRSREVALRHSHLQPNTPGKVAWLAFDTDQPDGATAWDRLHAPPPTLAVENPANGHAHLLYRLTSPVPCTNAARARPLLYLAAAEEGLRRKLEADPGYSGHLCKNPLHPRWSTREWGGAYSLGELADWVELPHPAEMQKRARDPDYAGLGRNCTLFEVLRQHAYRLVRAYWRPNGFEAFGEVLRALADGANATEYAIPLPASEVKSIAASVARWVWQRFDPATFREIQRRRGARKGASRRELLLPEVLKLIGEGKSQRAIAAAIGVSVTTINGWLKRGCCTEVISDNSRSTEGCDTGNRTRWAIPMYIKATDSRRHDTVPRDLLMRCRAF